MVLQPNPKEEDCENNTTEKEDGASEKESLKEQVDADSRENDNSISL